MYKKSVVPVKKETFSSMAAKRPRGMVAKAVLEQALKENRLSVGLMATLNYMSSDSGEALFCFNLRAIPGDSASHMQQVLLHAFCVENNIYMVNVDSDYKIRKILGVQTSEEDVTCVLVHCPYKNPFVNSQGIDPGVLSQAEKDLIDCCKGTIEVPLIKLPEK